MKLANLMIGCLLLSLTAGVAHAQLGVTATMLGGSFELGGSPAGDEPYKWVHVHAENGFGKPVPLELKISTWGQENEEASLPTRMIAAGGSVDLDLALPLRGYMQLQWRNLDGRLQMTTLGNDTRLFLHVSPTQGQATQAQLEDFSKPFRGAYTGRVEPIVSQIEARQLPANWLCLTPFRAVLMPEAEFNTLTPNQREPLLTWVRAGGDLTLYQAGRIATEKQMLGKIRRMIDNPLLNHAQGTPPEWGSNPLTWDNLAGNDHLFPFRIEGGGGNTGGLVLASLFFVLAGPLGLWWSNRRKQPHLLLKIVPILSGAFCLIMLVYFVASQGFQRIGGSFELHLLDEAAQRGTTVATQTLLSGLYPRGGFQYPQQAAVVPHGNRENVRSGTRMALGATQHLTRGWFIPRVPFNYTCVLPFETREHLVLEGDKLRNGFETAIAGGILYRPGGRLAIPALPPGASAAGAPLSAPANNDGLEGFLTPEEANYLRALLPALQMNLLAPEAAGSEFYIVKLKDGWGAAKDGSGGLLTGERINGPQTHILIGLRRAGQPEASHAAGV